MEGDPKRNRMRIPSVRWRYYIHAQKQTTGSRQLRKWRRHRVHHRSSQGSSRDANRKEGEANRKASKEAEAARGVERLRGLGGHGGRVPEVT